MKRTLITAFDSAVTARLMAIFACILSFGLIGALNPTNLVPITHAQTQTVRPDTAIATIQFDVGRLEQSQDSFGTWIEYDFRGQERYRFLETASTDTSLTLKGIKGSVKLFVDLKNKSISGEWPGHNMAKLYTIMSIDPMVFAPKSTDQPAIPAPTVSMPKAPISKPKPPKSSRPNTLAGPAPKKAPKLRAENVTQARYKGGSYVQKNDLDWIEATPGNAIFEFRKIGHDKNKIYLFDGSRDMFIELDIKKQVARVSDGEALRPLHDIFGISAKPLKGRSEITQTPRTSTTSTSQDPSVKTDPTKEDTAETKSQAEARPETDAKGKSANFAPKLSIKNRFECRREGGFVERAGLLGAERCTRRFSDAGNVCLDSSDCQGKCFTTSDAGKENATGKCQMTDNPFGCRAEVINGVAEFMLCVD